MSQRPLLPLLLLLAAGLACSLPQSFLPEEVAWRFGRGNQDPPAVDWIQVTPKTGASGQSFRVVVRFELSEQTGTLTCTHPAPDGTSTQSNWEVTETGDDFDDWIFEFRVDKPGEYTVECGPVAGGGTLYENFTVTEPIFTRAELQFDYTAITEASNTYPNGKSPTLLESMFTACVPGARAQGTISPEPNIFFSVGGDGTLKSQCTWGGEELSSVGGLNGKKGPVAVNFTLTIAATLNKWGALKVWTLVYAGEGEMLTTGNAAKGNANWTLSCRGAGENPCGYTGWSDVENRPVGPVYEAESRGTVPFTVMFYSE